jgi:hypothetical protein
MKLLPSSARMRRRLGILGVIALAGLGIWAWQTAAPPPKKVADAPTDPGAPQFVGRDRQVPLRRADRREINRVLAAFIPAAVERKDPLAAYHLATPEMRESATLAEWKRGDIPVYPYPASERRSWTLNFSYPGQVNFDLFVQPKKNADVGPIAFTVEMRRGKGRHWLVDSFFPTAMFPKPTKSSGGGQPLAQPDLSPANVQGTSQTGKQRVSTYFFFVPVVMLGLVLMIPLVMFVRGKLREERAERIYAKTPRGTLPPLPKPYQRSESEPEPERDRELVP